MVMIGAPSSLDTGNMSLPKYDLGMPAASKPKANWLGILADALSGFAGQPGMYAQRLAHERDAQSELEKGNERVRAEHQMARDDAQWKHDNFPDPTDVPSAVREYQYRQGLPEGERSGYDAFRQQTRPQIFGSAEGGYNVYNPSQGAPAMPTSPAPWADAPGGAGSPSRTFPLAPRAVPSRRRPSFPAGKLGW